MDYSQCLDGSLTRHPHSEELLLHEISLNSAGCEDHNPCIPHILAVLYPSLATKLNQLSTSDMILYPMFPFNEFCPNHQHNKILGRRSGGPVQISATLWHACWIIASEILCMYSITLPHTHLHRTLQSHVTNNNLYYLLPFSLPLTMAIDVQNKSAQTNATINAITYSEGTQCNSIQWYFLQKKTIILNWSDSYQTNPDTFSIFLHIQSNQKKWTASLFIMAI